MSYSGASATSVQTTGITNGTCQTSGPYKCSSHSNIVMFFKSGQKFTACPSANSSSGHSTTWILIQG
jgi:hypothetical protein